ncbi:AraC family transcriptional regulator [Rhizobium sp. R72]|uniref:helix-turn-helix domain-containing protein n=1 Tax=unclassified Rhizobium TaxID=2613769 RepID=UPI000B52F099|nr:MULTISPECIES: helix-turn-helix domain-containing protein [unclassified Rhizobium]OWV97613.1 AraC family transcriptional regulator [Rhizobium sp. R72]OWV97952.1 AraC family transcriptional regulator [Rhizobium sp. R711]
MTRIVPTYELYGENTGRKPDFWLHCETIPSRSSLHHFEIRPHRHDSFFQILYIDSGSGEALFSDAWLPIKAQSVITVPPAQDHGFRFSRDIDGFVITVLSSHLKAIPGDRSRLGGWMASPHLTNLDMGNEDARYVAACLQRLGREFSQRRAGRNDLLDAYLTTALLLTARISSQTQEDRPAADENERRMELLHDLLQRHFKSHQPAAFYAKALGISPTHLNRIVRAATGHGAHDLIARKLVDEAKRELVFTFGSVQEIAYRLGFSDPAYFSRFFLKQAGQTPRSWRMAQRAKLGV